MMQFRCTTFPLAGLNVRMKTCSNIDGVPGCAAHLA